MLASAFLFFKLTDLDSLIVTFASQYTRYYIVRWQKNRWRAMLKGATVASERNAQVVILNHPFSYNQVRTFKISHPSHLAHLFIRRRGCKLPHVT